MASVPEDNNEECNIDLDILARTTCGQLALLGHEERVSLIENCPALGSVNSDVFSKRSLVIALAARFATDIMPATFPSQELPLRLFQLGHPSVAWKENSPLNVYNSWLDEVMTDSSLSRCSEIAFVRACERGVAPESQHSREMAFDRLLLHYHPILVDLRRLDSDWEDAVIKAWREFDDKMLASNSEIIAQPLRLWLRKTLLNLGHSNMSAALSKVREFSSDELDNPDNAMVLLNQMLVQAFQTVNVGRYEIPKEKLLSLLLKQKANGRGRYAAIGSLVAFLEDWAEKRRDRLGFMLIDVSVDRLRQNAVPDEVLEKLSSLIGTRWRTKKQCTTEIIKSVGEPPVSNYLATIVKCLKRVRLDNPSTQAMPVQVAIPTAPPRDGSDALVNVTKAILENDLPNGEDICDAVGLVKLSEILTSTDHWTGCKHRKRWGERPPLTDIQRKRLVDCCILTKPANEMAIEANITRAAMHYSLFNAVRKIRCCIATELGDPFFMAARAVLKAYLEKTREWQRDPRRYEAKITAENETSDVKQKHFPLPGGGLLSTAFSREVTVELCATNQAIDQIAIDFHCDALTVSELAKEYKNNPSVICRRVDGRPVDQINFFLSDHWLKIADYVEMVRRLQEGRE